MAAAEATGGAASLRIGPAVRGATRAYLLTETADGFFPCFGFRTVSRAEVPEDVRDSVEFVSACPEGAVATVAVLGVLP